VVLHTAVGIINKVTANDNGMFFETQCISNIT